MWVLLVDVLQHHHIWMPPGAHQSERRKNFVSSIIPLQEAISGETPYSVGSSEEGSRCPMKIRKEVFSLPFLNDLHRAATVCVVIRKIPRVEWMIRFVQPGFEMFVVRNEIVFLN